MPLPTSSGGSAAAPYRGKDRRRTLPDTEHPLGRPFVAAGVLLVLAWFVIGVFSSADLGRVDLSAATSILRSAAAALALVVAVLCLVRWRLVGDAPAVLIGVALGLYGTTTLFLGGLLPLLYPVGGSLPWLRPASLLVVFVLFVWGFLTPPVDTRMHPRRILILGVAVALVLTAGSQIAAATWPASVLTESANATVNLISVSLWFLLATAFTWRGIRQQRWLFAWFGLMFWGFTFAELSTLLALDGGEMWALGRGGFLVMGLFAGLAGAMRELRRAFAQQGARLHESVLETIAVDARIRAEKAAEAERVHDARNALTAIEAATRTLEAFHDRLDSGTRANLGEAVSREIERLQRLIHPDAMRGSAACFEVADALGPIVTGARALGALVHYDIPTGVEAYGRSDDLAEVVQNLLENARRYAPGSPVWVWLEKHEGWLLLRVEDEGPGISPEQRDLIFERGWRADRSTNGSGLGLHVSRTLMRELGGAIWVEERDGGGASFVIALPRDVASIGPATGEELAEKIKKRRKPLKINLLLRARRRRQAAHAAAASGIRETDDDVHSEVGG